MKAKSKFVYVRVRGMPLERSNTIQFSGIYGPVDIEALTLDGKEWLCGEIVKFCGKEVKKLVAGSIEITHARINFFCLSKAVRYTCELRIATEGGIPCT